MDYETATAATVTTRAALAELAAHGFRAHATNAAIIETATGERIATVRNGRVRGADVLGWLGY